MHVTLLLTRLDIVKNSYCYEGGAPIMQVQISDLNINPLITLPHSPSKKKNQLPSNGLGTPNIKLFFYYGEQLGCVENTSLIICSQGKLYIYFQMQREGYIKQRGRLPHASKDVEELSPRLWTKNGKLIIENKFVKGIWPFPPPPPPPDLLQTV